MMVGLPIAALATTEMVTVIRDGHSGLLHTDECARTDLWRILSNAITEPVP